MNLSSRKVSAKKAVKRQAARKDIRASIATDEIGILPQIEGVLVHIISIYAYENILTGGRTTYSPICMVALIHCVVMKAG